MAAATTPFAALETLLPALAEKINLPDGRAPDSYRQMLAAAQILLGSLPEPCLNGLREGGAINLQRVGNALFTHFSKNTAEEAAFVAQLEILKTQTESLKEALLSLENALLFDLQIICRGLRALLPTQLLSLALGKADPTFSAQLKKVRTGRGWDTGRRMALTAALGSSALYSPVFERLIDLVDELLVLQPAIDDALKAKTQRAYQDAVVAASGVGGGAAHVDASSDSENDASLNEEKSTPSPDDSPRAVEETSPPEESASESKPPSLTSPVPAEAVPLTESEEFECARRRRCLVKAYQLTRIMQEALSQWSVGTVKVELPDITPSSRLREVGAESAYLAGPSVSLIARLAPVWTSAAGGVFLGIGVMAAAAKLETDAQKIFYARQVWEVHDVLATAERQKLKSCSPLAEACSQNLGVMLQSTLSTLATVLSFFPGLPMLAAAITFTALQLWSAVSIGQKAHRTHARLTCIRAMTLEAGEDETLRNFQWMVDQLANRKDFQALEALLAAGKRLKAAGVDFEVTALKVGDWKRLSELALRHHRNTQWLRCAANVVLSVVIGVVMVPLSFAKLGFGVVSALLGRLDWVASASALVGTKLAELTAKFSEAGRLHREVTTRSEWKSLMVLPVSRRNPSDELPHIDRLSPGPDSPSSHS